MNTATETSLAGSLEWHGGADIALRVRFDRLALDGNTVMLLSCVGAAGDLKALRAAFNIPLTSSIQLEGATLLRTDFNGQPRAHDVSYALAKAGGYACYSHRLGMGQFHGLFISRSPTLLLNDDDESLWQNLKERYTTPLLRSWLPYLKQQLIELNHLQPCAVMACHCCVLGATNKDLDGIVEHGLRNHHIVIQETP